MSWFSQWPKKSVRIVYPIPTEKQLDKIDSFHHAYYIVWSDKYWYYRLARGNDLRKINWNRKES